MEFNPTAGAKSLIEDAIGACSSETLAIVAEDPNLGIYDAMVPECVAEVAGKLGIDTKIIHVGDHAGLENMPKVVSDALSNFDHVLFHSRLGDTLRFSNIPGQASKTMSYALDLSILGGPSCTVPHRVMEEIRTAYNRVADAAETWRIRCAKGTDISGTQDIARVARGEAEDFTVTRYPVCAPRPLPCNTANGVVALTHWLMASGNQQYPDDEMLLPKPVMGHVEKGRIQGFEGPANLVERIEQHYRRVGETLNLDPWIVHSWHAGINPGCSYPINGTHNIERWGKVAFANPRYLHFHTCGGYAPGEIAWSMFDADVTLGDNQMWQKGELLFLNSPEVQTILARNGLEKLPFMRDIGID
ncbi:MAG: hypothetical protein P8M25_19460 [Paracoccaceae bacterium]|nr:hypothetical protein [Paracoccaceae bacterium]